MMLRRAGSQLLIVIGILAYTATQIISCKQPKSTQAPPSIDSAKTALGRYLFYDRRLSVNNTRSCATCHNPEFAFTDGYKRSLGAFADIHQRNTQPLFNLSSLKYLTAADSTIHTLLQQMDNPLLKDHPLEMGVKGNEEKILRKIMADPVYLKGFERAHEEMSWRGIKNAISTFVLSLRSANAPFDRYMKGDSNSLTAEEKRGKALFFSRSLNCNKCHGGDNFSTPEENDPLLRGSYFNTGLYNVDRKGSYSLADQGLYELTKNKADMGKFRVPSLRNLAFTGPYFHDGTAASLTEVIDIYAAGGRITARGADSGDGRSNKYKHPFIGGFTITGADKINLVRFLISLSDTSFVNNPAYRNPFNEDETEKKY